jgi:SAM-dependent methyltransferase
MDTLDLSPAADARLDRRIHDRDSMLISHLKFAKERYGHDSANAHARHVDHYFNVGRSAFRSIRLAQLAVGARDPERILDFGCGYGRVMRFLRAAYPDATIVGADVDPGGTFYCAEVFGAEALVLTGDPRAVSGRRPFDLVWAGSVLTHLPEQVWRGTLSAISRVLTPGGILVFTTHGRRVVGRLPHDDFYGLTPEGRERALRDYHKYGFGYADYPNASGYGVSLSAPQWVIGTVTSAVPLKVVSYTESGWDDHQDVVSCQTLTVD